MLVGWGACRVGGGCRKRSTLLREKKHPVLHYFIGTHYIYCVWEYNYGSESEKRRERCLKWHTSIYGSFKCYTSEELCIFRMQCSNLTSYKQIFEYKKTKFSKGLFLPYPRQRNWYTFQTKHEDIEKRRTVEVWYSCKLLIRSCFF